jgi:hypothetical protein
MPKKWIYYLIISTWADIEDDESGYVWVTDKTMGEILYDFVQKYDIWDY